MNNNTIEEVFVDDDEFNFKAKYDEFNKKYFGNTLPTDSQEQATADLIEYENSWLISKVISENRMILIKTRVGKKNAGYCAYAPDYVESKPGHNVWKPFLIQIRKGWDYNTIQDLEAVLLHEMCHASICMKYGSNKNFISKIERVKQGHGPEWESEMKRVQDLYGYDLGGRYVDPKTTKAHSAKDVKDIKAKRLSGMSNDDIIKDSKFVVLEARYGNKTIYSKMLLKNYKKEKSSLASELDHVLPIKVYINSEDENVPLLGKHRRGWSFRSDSNMSDFINSDKELLETITEDDKASDTEVISGKEMIIIENIYEDTTGYNFITPKVYDKYKESMKDDAGGRYQPHTINVYGSTHPEIISKHSKNNKYPFTTGRYPSSDRISKIIDSQLTEKLAEFI